METQLCSSPDVAPGACRTTRIPKLGDQAARFFSDAIRNFLFVDHVKIQNSTSATSVASRSVFSEPCGIPLIAPHRLLPVAVEWVVPVLDLPALRGILLPGCFLAPKNYRPKLHDDHNPVYRSFGLCRITFCCINSSAYAAFIAFAMPSSIHTLSHDLAIFSRRRTALKISNHQTSGWGNKKARGLCPPRFAANQPRDHYVMAR